MFPDLTVTLASPELAPVLLEAVMPLTVLPETTLSALPVSVKPAVLKLTTSGTLIDPCLFASTSNNVKLTSLTPCLNPKKLIVKVTPLLPVGSKSATVERDEPVVPPEKSVLVMAGVCRAAGPNGNGLSALFPATVTFTPEKSVPVV